MIVTPQLIAVRIWCQYIDADLASTAIPYITASIIQWQAQYLEVDVHVDYQSLSLMVDIADYLMIS